MIKFGEKFIGELTTAVIREMARRERQGRLELERSLMLARWEEVRKYREGLPPFDKGVGSPDKRKGVNLSTQRERM